MRNPRSLTAAFLMAAIAAHESSPLVVPVRERSKEPRKFTDARIAEAEAKRQRKNARRAELAKKESRNE